MAKTLTLSKLAAKRYLVVEGIPERLKASIGRIEDAFDAIIYGPSGNGKSNFTAALIADLISALNCKCEYISYEEGHGMTLQETLIGRLNLHERLGNAIQITDHLTFQELQLRMRKRNSAKIWVVDSLQASALTYENCKSLKEEFVLSRKRKIVIFVSWSEGKTPKGSVAKAVEYYANIKMRVSDFVVFPKSRYGGNKPYVIWEEGAKKNLQSAYYRITGENKPRKSKKATTDEIKVESGGGSDHLSGATAESEQDLSGEAKRVIESISIRRKGTSSVPNVVEGNQIPDEATI